jgi:hypothetical protein
MTRSGCVRSLLVALGAVALAALASAQVPVKPSKETTRAAQLGVPIDPVTRVDPASPPVKLGRRALAALGLEQDPLHDERAATYSAAHLEDENGELTVYYASVVKQAKRWVFWAEELPQQTVRRGSEIQLAFNTQRDARYLVDFALDSAQQDFAVVIGDTRTTQAPAVGHLALVVNGTGKRLTLRALPLGDGAHQALRYTLFQVTVTPIG